MGTVIYLSDYQKGVTVLISMEHNNFRNLRLSVLHRYLAGIVDAKRFNVPDLTPWGMLHRIATDWYHIFTFDLEDGFWIIDDGRLISHPFSGDFLSACYHTGTSLDPNNPLFRQPAKLAEGIRDAIGSYIAEYGDAYIFCCGGRRCRYGFTTAAVSAA